MADLNISKVVFRLDDGHVVIKVIYPRRSAPRRVYARANTAGGTAGKTARSGGEEGSRGNKLQSTRARILDAGT